MVNVNCGACGHLNSRGYCSLTACIFPCSFGTGGYINKPITNGDRIRAMTDEELAKTMKSTGECPPSKCPYAYADLSENGGNITDDQCVECWLDWLKQEATT